MSLPQLHLLEDSMHATEWKRTVMMAKAFALSTAAGMGSQKAADSLNAL